ncbi:ZZ-type zinc finger-containing protein [Phanerochaete sordida]|uniref:ZZ-type zinc finger-containing protein n=1 Tax=Phanerochaete sordida TaxID=48140 RepID=A0A9P3GRF8_9APHY|nr:ZZ-type zinc finger-containing protein [Phanerochaete sordida]
MSSRYAASDYDSAEARPDKPLVVKCNYEGVNKRITFSSSRTCTFDLLKHRVEQCFSLSQTSYAITYTDDDGETTVITTETDLTEAIRYFYPGASDDPPLSSAASILSGRSFGRSKITLRVRITIDYDGPSLSDTSSLASTDEYQNRNDDNFSLSLSSSSVGSGPFGGAAEVEDDARTVSSKDTGARSRSKYSFFRSRGTKTVVPGACKRSRSAANDEWEEETVSSVQKTLSLSGGGSVLPSIADNDEDAVFERLREQEAAAAAAEGEEDPQSASYGSTALQNERGVAWLREQNQRTLQLIRPGPGERARSSPRVDRLDQLSVPDTLSLPDTSSLPDTLSLPGDEAGSTMSGELALEKGNDGRFYYAYTSGSAEMSSGRPPSRDGSWQDLSSSRPSSSSRHSPNHRSHSEPILLREELPPDIPPELLPFITMPLPPPADPTDCSSCGALLEQMRYVCSTCGEKEPASKTRFNGIDINGKGKARDNESFGASTATFTYPPHSHRATEISPTVSSWTLVADNSNPFDDSRSMSFKQKPLPALPSSPSSSPSNLTIPSLGLRSGSTSSSSLSSSHGPGFELCFNCIATVGVVHALEASIDPDSSPLHVSPEEGQRTLSEWRRTASRKGHLRHAYLEKYWTPRGWDNVEHDDRTTVKCSTCPSTIVGKRYKCAVCENFNLCKACYSQVHEIHPSDPFLVILEKPTRTRSEPVIEHIEHPTLTPDETGELSMTHAGVRCAHCLMEIVGARFHCAICPSIDICSNCESAGLPGNLDSSDDGHNSSHIMIKIPYPLPSQELEVASRRAKQLWGRDAATVDEETKRSRRGSLGSGYARTVMAPSAPTADTAGDGESHGIRCDVCRKMILGTRYQCAMCPSKPQGYNLCTECEARSYAVHDPMHVFFKLPRPVDIPIEVDGQLLPILYRVPAGPPGGILVRERPKEYLRDVKHTSAVCDRCMERIHGEWFRCVYCGKDLCDNCEAVDTHDYKHFFMMFKSTVDMQRFRRFAQLDSQENPPPVLPFAVYTS